MAADLDQLRRETWRNESPIAFARVKLDMDGDSLKGKAVLVTETFRHSLGLRVCIARKALQATSERHILYDSD